MATYDQIGEVYDLVYPDTAERVPFVKKILKKYYKQTVLELGIGTGLFAIPLHEAGFNIEGLEISKVMVDVLRQKAPTLKVHQGDIQHFVLDDPVPFIAIDNPPENFRVYNSYDWTAATP